MPKDEVQQEENSNAESLEVTDATKDAAVPAIAEQSETQPDNQAAGPVPSGKKGGFQRRIDELTREKYEALAKAEMLKELLLTKEHGKPPAPSDTPLTEPNPDDYETTADYFRAIREYDRKQSERTFRALMAEAEETRRVRDEQAILAGEWAEREEATREKHPDYDDVSGAAVNILTQTAGPGRETLARTLQRRELGTDLLYYLGQHPDELKTLVRMATDDVGPAIGRLEARLVTETKGAENSAPQTRLPKPPTPIRKPAAAEPVAPDDPASDKLMSDAEWARKRNEQVFRNTRR
jgi:hypothetical protein